MSVIIEARVSAGEFELGRLFEAGMGADAAVELETVVPVDGGAVLYFRLRTERLDSFLETVREGSLVDGVRVIDEYGDESLVALDWNQDRDSLFRGLSRADVAVLDARGGQRTWTFVLRFDDHAALDDVREHCATAGIDLHVDRLYSPESPERELSFGVTDAQYEALTLALERGYYDVPRQVSTRELGEELGVSDQAVSERLRRGIAALVCHTLAPGAGSS